LDGEKGDTQVAEITRKRQGELVRGVFAVLKDHRDGLPARVVLERLERVVPPTPFEKSTYPKDPKTRRFEKIVRFSSITAVKAGWLVKNKGTWFLTEEGLSAYDEWPDPETFMRESIALYAAWKKTQMDPEDTESPIDESSAGASSTLEEAEESAWAEIQDYLGSINPYDLQELVAGLLEAMGYHVSWTAPPGPDGGLDVTAYTDPLGTQGPRIKVQVKRRQDKMNVQEVRSLLALLGDHDVGIFVSTGGFTSEADRLVREQERRRVTLVDLGKLFDLWVDHYDRIPDAQRQLLPLKPIYYLAPPE
jgi:restriction system protein